MGESWFEVIKQVGIFMICAQMLLHFKASENYGKYIRLLMSMMVLIQLAVPLSGLLRGRTGENLAQGLTRYETLLTEQRGEINEACIQAEQLLEELTLEEIKTRINNQKTEECEREEDISEETADAKTAPVTIEPIEISLGGTE